MIENTERESTERSRLVGGKWFRMGKEVTEKAKGYIMFSGDREVMDVRG